MPIRPEMRDHYPANWKAIVRRINARAEYRCECAGECGVVHVLGRCIELHKQPADNFKGRVVLTVAHLNHDPRDCRDENLKAMCQRCHLRYDREHHANTRRARDTGAKP